MTAQYREPFLIRLIYRVTLFVILAVVAVSLALYFLSSGSGVDPQRRSAMLTMAGVFLALGVSLGALRKLFVGRIF